MDDKNAVAQNVVETETTQTSSPQVEAPITEEQTMKQEAIVQTPVAESSDMPESIEEQRRAFQELRQENKRLKEERETAPKEESAFNVFRQQTPSVMSTNPVRVEDYSNPLTGETNWQDYNAAQQNREQAIIQQAKAEARSEVQEILDEEKARAKYPELMSNPAIEKQIAARWLYEKVQGNTVSVTDIAGEFARNFKQAVSKAEKVGAERTLNEVVEKEKAGLVATGQSSQASSQVASQEETERLRLGTRRGSQDSITARISKIPWANK